MRLRAWAVVDTWYKPRPIIVECSPNQDNMRDDAAARNSFGEMRGRYRVISVAGEFKRAAGETEGAK